MTGLQPGDGQAERSRNPVYDALERVKLVDRGVKDWASEKLSFRLAIGDVEVVNVVLLKEFHNPLSGVESGVAIRTVWKDADPDGYGAGNRLAAAILSLLLPTEANQVDGGELDLVIVEELDRLGTNISSHTATLRESHKPLHESSATAFRVCRARGR